MHHHMQNNTERVSHAKHGNPRNGSKRSVPTGNETTFGAEEIIVSKTDLNGRITYANDVFLRVAGYSEDEVLGQPHSFIRHPDMPRCVFKLLWDSIQAGREIFAYVVNLTKTGDHYWVFAHVTPSLDVAGRPIGFHSNRRCPNPAQVARVRSLYAALLDEERRHASKADAIEASTRLLERVISETHGSYDEFVFSI